MIFKYLPSANRMIFKYLTSANRMIFKYLMSANWMIFKYTRPSAACPRGSLSGFTSYNSHVLLTCDPVYGMGGEVTETRNRKTTKSLVSQCVTMCPNVSQCVPMWHMMCHNVMQKRHWYVGPWTTFDMFSFQIVISEEMIEKGSKSIEV